MYSYSLEVYTNFAVLAMQKSMQSQKHLTPVFTFGKLSQKSVGNEMLLAG